MFLWTFGQRNNVAITATRLSLQDRTWEPRKTLCLSHSFTAFNIVLSWATEVGPVLRAGYKAVNKSSPEPTSPRGDAKRLGDSGQCVVGIRTAKVHFLAVLGDHTQGTTELRFRTPF